MNSKLKLWTGLGVATALMGSGLAGCAGESGGEGGKGGEAAQTGEAGSGGEGGEAAGGEGEGGEAGANLDAGALELPERLAFMSGHVAAGLALYRAGDAEGAAPHLLHPVSETHASERAGLAELGFDAAAFEAVSAALESGQPAAEIEPLLASAEANLAEVRGKAGGDPADIIRFLMDTAVAEYSVAVADGGVTDPAEYQDAWGFTRVAYQIAADLNTPRAEEVRSELNTMLALWPEEGPIPPSDPAPVGQVSALASKVTLALPQPAQ